jgi:hypothetical protein
MFFEFNSLNLNAIQLMKLFSLLIMLGQLKRSVILHDLLRWSRIRGGGTKTSGVFATEHPGDIVVRNGCGDFDCSGRKPIESGDHESPISSTT